MKVVIDEEKLMDLLEYQWGYEGIRKMTMRIFLTDVGVLFPKDHKANG